MKGGYRPKTRRFRVIETHFVPSRYGIPGYGSKRLKLECGHILTQRNSAYQAARMWCKQCESNAEVSK